jgi:hypothetical protein
MTHKRNRWTAATLLLGAALPFAAALPAEAATRVARYDGFGPCRISMNVDLNSDGSGKIYSLNYEANRPNGMMAMLMNKTGTVLYYFPAPIFPTGTHPSFPKNAYISTYQCPWNEYSQAVDLTTNVHW